MGSWKRASGLLAVAVVSAGMLALSGCSAPQEATDRPHASASAESATEGVDTDKIMRDFVTAVYSSDFETSESLVAPESAAAKYLLHQKATETAYKANGDFVPTDPADQPTLEFKDGTAIANYGSAGTFTWSDFEYDSNGLITSWTTPSGQLPGLLWSTDFAGAIAGNSVTLTSAYKTNAGEMHAVLAVTAGSGGIDFLMPDQAQFVASDGIAYSAQYSSAPRQSLPAGATGYVALVFPQAPFGGTIYLEGYNIDDTNLWKAEIPVS